MKFSIEKAEFQRGLARIQSIVEKRNTMPILANALLELTGKGKNATLEISATDLEVGIRSQHPCEVASAGRLTVAARKLHEIVRELPDATIHLESSSNAYLTLRCARAEFTLAGTTAEEYPTLSTVAPEDLVTLPAAVLSEMIERTMYSASADETRYNLNGVFVERIADTGKLRMVATDGHRLAYVDRAIGDGFANLAESGVIIPRKGLAELKRLVDEEDSDEIELGFEGNSALARKGGVTLSMRLIEGEFPNYRQVIPEPGGSQLVLTSDTLVHALRRVALLSAERSRAVKIELSEGQMSLSSNNPDLGDAREEIDIDYSGEPTSIAFNARYLIDALGALGGKEVRFGYRDALAPAQLSPTDDEDSLAVVMPMRL